MSPHSGNFPPLKSRYFACRETQVLEHLPSKHEAPSSNPRTVKKKKKKADILILQKLSSHAKGDYQNQ
jgi:hypothetical protein